MHASMRMLTPCMLGCVCSHHACCDTGAHTMHAATCGSGTFREYALSLKSIADKSTSSDLSILLLCPCGACLSVGVACLSVGVTCLSVGVACLRVGVASLSTDSARLATGIACLQLSSCIESTSLCSCPASLSWSLLDSSLVTSLSEAGSSFTSPPSRGQRGSCPEGAGLSLSLPAASRGL